MAKEIVLTERQKQIKKAFGRWLTSDSNSNKFGFIGGAEWADANPSDELIEKIGLLSIEYDRADDYPGCSLIEYVKKHLK